MSANVTCLIFGIVAEVDDHLLGAGVEHVEKFPVLSVEADVGEIVDAPKTVDQFSAECNGTH